MSECESCREFVIDQVVQSPAQLEDLAKGLRQAVSDGRLVLLGAPDTVTPWALAAGDGRSPVWPDSIAWPFFCPVCRRVFQLTVDNYHGTAAWRCVPDADVRAGTRVVLHGFETLPEIQGPSVPVVARLVQQLRTHGRPDDHWLAELEEPVVRHEDGVATRVTHLALNARDIFEPMRIGARSLPVSICTVTDQSLLADSELDWAKVSPLESLACDFD